MTPVTIEVRGNSFSLFPQKGIYWHQGRTLLVSDIHIGKTAAFRSMDIPAPGGSASDDLNKLTFLMKYTQPDELIILGDMIHTDIDGLEKTLQAVKMWRIDNEKVNITLIKGNHDVRSDAVFERLKITLISDQLIKEEFVFVHHGLEVENKFVFSGHIHPAVRLSGKGGMKEQVPCFYFSDNFAILPSFGSFTGSYIVKPKDFERIFAVAEEEVIEVITKTRN